MPSDSEETIGSDDETLDLADTRPASDRYATLAPGSGEETEGAAPELPETLLAIAETLELGDSGAALAKSDPNALAKVCAQGDEAVEIAEALRDTTRRLGPYVVLRELGKGGMGVVLKAFDPRLCRLVAIKQILGNVDERMTLRFAREARVMAQLSHPHIAPVYEGVAEGPGAPYLVMEFIRGEALIDLLREGPLAGRRAAEILAPIAEAIDYAHGKGIVHRDLKPHNIMLTADGVPVVLDFGLARREGSESVTLTGSGGVVGTPAYMAPEQAGGAHQAGPPADIYGLGATLYHCITGVAPFGGDSALAVIQAVTSSEPVAPRSHDERIHRDLETICLQCLEKDPAARYGSAGELASDLRRFARGEPITARRAPTLVRLLRRAWRRRSVALPLSVVLVALAVGVPTWLHLREAKLVAEGERERAQQEKALAEEAKADSERHRVALQQALGLLEELAEVQRYRYRPPLPRAEEDQLVSGARARARSVLERLNAALAQAPELPHLYVIRGQAELEVMDLKAALASAQLAIDRAPDHAPAWELLARARCAAVAMEFFGEAGEPIDRAAKKGRAEEAYAAYEEAKRLGANPPGILHAWAHLFAGQVDVADARLREAERGPPSEELAYARAVLALHQHGMDAAALREHVLPHLDKALRLCPRMLPAVYSRGIARREVGELPGAVEDLRMAVRLDPGFAMAHYDLGEVHTRLGDGVAAEAAFRRADELRPDHARTWNGIGFARFLQGRLREAIEAYDRSIALRPSPETHCNRGSAKVRLGDREGGIADFTSAIAVDPTYVGAWNNRGLERAAGGDLSGGIADLSRALETDASYTPGWVNRAKLRLEAQDLPGALADADRAVKLQPELADAYYFRALAKAMSGDLDGAVVDMDVMIRLKPDYALAWNLRGSLKKVLGRLDDAALDFEQSLRFDPSQRGASGLRAFVAQQLGRPSKH